MTQIEEMELRLKETEKTLLKCANDLGNAKTDEEIKNKWGVIESYEKLKNIIIRQLRNLKEREKKRQSISKVLQLFDYKDEAGETYECRAIHVTYENRKYVINYFKQYKIEVKEVCLNYYTGLLIDASSMDSYDDFVFVKFGDWLDDDGTGAFSVVEDKKFRKQYGLEEKL